MSRTLRHPAAHLRRLCAAVLAAACSAGAAADRHRPVIEAPHYGDALFHFYQDHYFSSITTLMASQHFERVGRHADDAEVLRGGLLLSYGLHRDAGEIFARLIEKGAPPAVQDRAWFYLAKIRYQRGFLDQALDAIARIGKNLPPDLDEERALLHANVLMAREAYADAAEVLNGLSKGHGAGHYVRYNLGVALVKKGETESGGALLELVGKMRADDEETRGLRDRANLALGYAALQAQQPDAAKAALERVRLSGLHAAKALLGFGWAEASNKSPQRALVAWNELASRDPSDAAVLEARLAVPYAYAELGAYGQALERYNEALAAYQRENAALDESIAAIRSGKLLAGLLAANPGEEMGWFWNIRQLPDMPHSGHLAPVLARHDFQEAFKNYRDLKFLEGNLQGWLDKLGAFEDMLANRRKAYADRLPQIRERARDAGLGVLERRRGEVARDLELALERADGIAFADANEKKLLERIGNVRDGLAHAGNDREIANAAERLRRAAGALTWKLAQEFPERAWDSRKGLNVIDAQLEQARAREAAIARAQLEEPARFDAFERRIADLAGRIRALVPRVAALSAEQQGEVHELAVAELAWQQDRLVGYVTQAQFAVAQLLDRAQLAQDDDHAKQP